MTALQSSPVWQQLKKHHQEAKSLHMRDLFVEDAERAERYNLRVGPLLLDYSKNRINAETLRLLLSLARQQDVETWRDRLFAGDKINHTENRAVLHVALRNQSGKPVLIDRQDVMPEIKQMYEKMTAFVTDIHAGTWRGYTGKPITRIINIGIGGSDLGPLLFVDALSPYAKAGIKVDFISNIDGYPLQVMLDQCDPATTLFIIASKSFSTLETRQNAETVRSWFLKHAHDIAHVARHFVAVSSNIEAAAAFGISRNNIFPLWDWVGGRYSVWSAIGLAVALSIGMPHFNAILKGAGEMDQHFMTASLESNMPVLLALMGVWYINFFGVESTAILPYDQRLQYFSAYLQQVEMESNGKQVDRQGERLDYRTAPVIWGTVGTNGQHAYFQLLHQGSLLIPIDFILVAQHPHSMPVHHQALIANCLAQSEALMQGKTAAQARVELNTGSIIDRSALVPYYTFEGNQPSNTLLLDELTPETLGMLVALYEHKVFVQGIIWDINSFDQWGVEYGKRLASQVEQWLREESEQVTSTAEAVSRKRTSISASTTHLISELKRIQSLS